MFDLCLIMIYNFFRKSDIMNHEFKINDFSKENVDFCFKNLLFNLICSINYKEYEFKKEEFQKNFELVVELFKIYLNDNSLKNIDLAKLEDIKDNLISLDYETQRLSSYYGEWSRLWLENLMKLKINFNME